jgi:hypothetical protein
MRGDHNRYYLVTAVARTPSITLIAKDERSRGVDVDVGALKLAAGSVGVDVDASSNLGVTYRGPKPLAFGVELLELSFDEERNALRFEIPDEPVRIRKGSTASIGAGEVAGRDFIGPSDGDAFVELD